MYIPRHFEERDPGVLHALVRSHPLGTWVVSAIDGLVVNHIPFVLDETPGPLGMLVGHVSRANEVWKSAVGRESVVVFQGPQAYITPSWYPSKQEHGKVVPTWNYAVVHVHGRPRVIEDQAWLRQHVSNLTSVHESTRQDPWLVTDAPTDFIGGLLKGIVGIEIPIDRLEGKWKVGQNRSEADRRGAAAGLQALNDDESRAMARLVEERPNSSDQ